MNDRDHIQQLIDEGTPRDQIVQEVQRMNETVVDLNNIRTTPCNWVKRGIVWSCEGAGHPPHRHWVRRPKQ